MSGIITVLREFKGTGFLLVLYGIALLYILFLEKDRRIRIFLGALPAVILVLFLLPPVYAVYTKFESGTYYRFLWLLPMSITILTAGTRASIRFLKKFWLAGVAALMALLVCGGSVVYRNPNVLPAENLLHVPHQVVDVCDYILADHDSREPADAGGQVKAAFPSNIVQFIRQYTSRINMPYGREMLVPQWDYYNEVYEVMEKPETIDAAALAAALRDTKCDYLILQDGRAVAGDPGEEGLTLLGNVDGFNIFIVNPDEAPE